MGRVVNAFHHNRLCSLLKDHHGRVVIGNADAHDNGNLTPTVVLNPSRDSELMKSEIFGPILPIYTFQKIEEVIQQIKEGEKPLAIYYFGGRNSSNYTKIESETSSGALVTNETLFQVCNPNLPFGGVGYSGYGRYHGHEGFKQFSNMKSIFSKHALNIYPYNKVFPPFTQSKQGLIRFLLKYLGCTQKQFVKRIIWLIIFIYIAKKVITGELQKFYRKWKKIGGIIGPMLPMLMK